MSRGPRNPSRDAQLLPRDIDVRRAEALIDAAGDLALVLDAEGTILDVRARDRELLKTARKAWLGKAWIDTVTVESRDKVGELLAAALDDNPSPPRQVNHPAVAGPDLPLLYATVRLGGGVRGAVRVVALGRDLRDTVMLQRRLVDAQQAMERDYWRFREAETRYRNLFQSSAEAVLIVDGRTLRVTEANPAALALLGAAGNGKAGKVIDAALSSLFAAEAAEPLAAAVASARSVGRHERLQVPLVQRAQAVTLSMAAFRQEEASFLLVRITPVSEPVRSHRGNGRAPPPGDDAAGGLGFEAAFVRHAADALAFTDAGGRVVAVNRAFARLAQLSSEDQARGQPLDRWLGRTGVELAVLLTNLRDQAGNGTGAGLFSTELRGALGVVTPVEVAASTLAGSGSGAGAPAFAFSLRDVGRRLAPGEEALATKVPASVAQLTELVGRVPLKQIVAETSDLIERLSIETALSMTKDNRAMAAQLLGLSRQSLYVKLRRFGLGGLESES